MFGAWFHQTFRYKQHIFYFSPGEPSHLADIYCLVKHERLRFWFKKGLQRLWNCDCWSSVSPASPRLRIPRPIRMQSRFPPPLFRLYCQRQPISTLPCHALPVKCLIPAAPLTAKNAICNLWVFPRVDKRCSQDPFRLQQKPEGHWLISHASQVSLIMPLFWTLAYAYFLHF